MGWCITRLLLDLLIFNVVLFMPAQDPVGESCEFRVMNFENMQVELPDTTATTVNFTFICEAKMINCKEYCRRGYYVIWKKNNQVVSQGGLKCQNKQITPTVKSTNPDFKAEINAYNHTISTTWVYAGDLTPEDNITCRMKHSNEDSKPGEKTFYFWRQQHSEAFWAKIMLFLVFVLPLMVWAGCLWQFHLTIYFYQFQRHFLPSNPSNLTNSLLVFPQEDAFADTLVHKHKLWGFHTICQREILLGEDAVQLYEQWIHSADVIVIVVPMQDLDWDVKELFHFLNCLHQCKSIHSKTILMVARCNQPQWQCSWLRWKKMLQCLHDSGEMEKQQIANMLKEIASPGGGGGRSCVCPMWRSAISTRWTLTWVEAQCLRVTHTA